MTDVRAASPPSRDGETIHYSAVSTGNTKAYYCTARQRWSRRCTKQSWLIWWALGADQEIVWECNGIAGGRQMESYRAGGYGRLSLYFRF
jgi:hypothetical protein